MTYRAYPVRSYETEEGCTVVSQIQENAHGLVIEHVALMCLRAGGRLDSFSGGRHEQESIKPAAANGGATQETVNVQV